MTTPYVEIQDILEEAKGYTSVQGAVNLARWALGRLAEGDREAVGLFLRLFDPIYYPPNLPINLLSILSKWSSPVRTEWEDLLHRTRENLRDNAGWTEERIEEALKGLGRRQF